MRGRRARHRTDSALPQGFWKPAERAVRIPCLIAARRGDIQDVGSRSRPRWRLPMLTAGKGTQGALFSPLEEFPTIAPDHAHQPAITVAAQAFHEHRLRPRRCQPFPLPANRLAARIGAGAVRTTAPS